MSEQIQAGMVVQLRSGGPRMTVNQTGEQYGGKPGVWCEWFGDKNKLETAVFSPESLQIVKSS